MTAVTRWYLVMDSPAELRPAKAPAETVSVGRVGRLSPEFGRFLYSAVGWRWYWVDRLSWTWDDWQRLQTRSGYELWVMWQDGAPAGFYELDRRPRGETEILLFGLVPALIGRGLGGHLLTHAVERAWQEGTRRVVLNTCSLDHPAAKDAYQARGFRVERIEELDKELPAPADGPWPGAALTGTGPEAAPGFAPGAAETP